MCCFRPYWLLIGLVGFALGVGAVYFYTLREAVPSYIPPPFEELPIKGFGEVTSAKDGELVSIEGFIDEKGGCLSYQLGISSVCEAYLWKAPDESIPVRIAICDEGRRSDCIPPFSTPIDWRQIFLYDYNGQVFDFDGYEIIEPPNGGMFKSKPVRLTGKVTTVNGSGRLISTVTKIEAAPPAN